MKNIRIFYLKIFIFLVVKFSVYLNRHVFVMSHGQWTTRSGCMPAVSFGGLISSSVQSTGSKPSGSKQRGPGSDCRDEAAESDQVTKKCVFRTIIPDSAIYNQKMLIFSHFSMKTNVVGTHWKCLTEVLPMNTYNICFHGEIRKLFSLNAPVISISGAMRTNNANTKAFDQPAKLQSDLDKCSVKSFLKGQIL